MMIPAAGGHRRLQWGMSVRSALVPATYRGATPAAASLPAQKNWSAPNGRGMEGTPARVSAGYEEMWEKLRRGEYDKGRYLRWGKNGKQFWLDAIYSPLPDADGK